MCTATFCCALSIELLYGQKGRCGAAGFLSEVGAWRRKGGTQAHRTRKQEVLLAARVACAGTLQVHAGPRPQAACRIGRHSLDNLQRGRLSPASSHTTPCAEIYNTTYSSVHVMRAVPAAHRMMYPACPGDA